MVHGNTGHAEGCFHSDTGNPASELMLLACPHIKGGPGGKMSKPVMSAIGPVVSRQAVVVREALSQLLVYHCGWVIACTANDACVFVAPCCMRVLLD